MIAANGAQYIGEEPRGLNGEREMVWCDPVEEGADCHWQWPSTMVGVVGWEPDTSKDLTVMGLLLIYREASGHPRAYLWPARKGGWSVFNDTTISAEKAAGNGATEADAVVSALETVAGRTP